MAVRTAKQKAALKKAQAASARKRRGKGRGRATKARRGSGSKMKKRSSRLRRVAMVGAAVGSMMYANTKFRKYQSITARDKRYAEEAGYRRRDELRRDYGNRMRLNNAKNRGLPSSRGNGTTYRGIVIG